MSDSVATPCTIACQAPLSMGFPRQECWSGLPFPSPGDLRDPGIEPRFPALEADALTSEPPGKPTEELSKKDLHDPHNHDGVITHLEPDILECEVRWASESITSCIRELYNITVLHSVLYKYQWNLIA